MNIIPYGKQEITDEDIKAVTKVLKSDFLTQGPAVEEFEKSFATYVGAKFAVAVSNGTAALHLASIALKVKPGQLVITSPITFAASSNAILYCGGSTEFVDIDPQTYCLDIEKVKVALKSKPKGSYSGLVVVDYAGYPVDMESFRKLADEYSLWLIEDACHAPGAEFKNSEGVWQKCGSSTYADLSTFSFHPVKHIATGEGGMITTNQPDLYQELLKLRTHGITKDPTLFENKNDGGWYYEMQELGYNYRISDLLCALGTSQLTRADKNLNRRLMIAAKYDIELAGLPIILPKRGPEIKHSFHLYVIQSEQRKKLYEFLRTKNIYSQVHYVPVNRMPFYQRLGYTSENTLCSNDFYEKCLSLPIYPSMTDEEQDYVIRSIKEFYL